MADNGIPWSIKGVSAEARASARDAAKRAGLPVGAWLVRAIRDIAAAEAQEHEKHENPVAAGPEATAEPHD